VGAVAIRAYSTGQQTLFDQSLSMYAAGIIHQNVSTRELECSRLSQFAMAIPAQLGDIGTVGLIALIQM